MTTDGEATVVPTTEELALLLALRRGECVTLPASDLRLRFTENECRLLCRVRGGAYLHNGDGMPRKSEE